MREHAPRRGGLRRLLRLPPHRGIPAIQHRAWLEGATRKRHWSVEEDAYLRRVWGESLFNVVPFRGVAPSFIAMMSGQLDLICEPVSSFVQRAS